MKTMSLTTESVLITEGRQGEQASRHSLYQHAGSGGSGDGTAGSQGSKHGPRKGSQKKDVTFLESVKPHFTYVSVFFLMTSWPALLLLTPVLFPLLVCRVLFDIVRAVDYQPWRAVKLVFVAAGHYWGSVSLAPLLCSVMWYYNVRAKSDNVIKDVPFAVCPYDNPRARSSRRGSSSGSLYSSPSLSSEGGGSAASTPRNQSPTGSSSSPAGLSMTAEHCIAECRLDVYRHSPGPNLRPVLLFVYGGGFNTGWKGYYSKLAALLRNTTGAVVVVPDYPLYPAAGVSTMVDCLYHVLRWIHGNIAKYGGDPKQVHLAGHSCGGHLVMQLLLRRALALSNDQSCPLPSGCLTKVPFKSPVPWILGPSQNPYRGSGGEGPSIASPLDYRHCPSVASASLLSGLFDLHLHYEFEHRRCVERISALEGAVGGHWQALSPTVILNAIPPQHTHTPMGSSLTSATTDSRDREREYAQMQAAAGAGGCGTPNAPGTPTSAGTNRLSRDRLMGLSGRRIPAGLVLDPSHLPYFMVCHAEGDHVVDPLQSVSLREALVRHGVQCSELELLRCSHSDVALGPMRSEAKGGGLKHPTVTTLMSAIHS